ncbi:MAG: serine hydrolase domain-containing protein [Bacteroidota bacterium]
MRAYDAPGSPGGAVAVVRAGEVVFAKGYGAAHLEHEAPITPETVFYIGSVGKQFTAFAIAMLAERGMIDLDANVHTYLPELDLDRPVTVRQLVHHTSGLRDSFGLLTMAGVRDGDLVTQEIARDLVLRQRELNFKPGTEFGYSNSNYIALAEIVERVTGDSFRAWMEREVFRPLGMNHTFVGDDHREIVPGRAASYRPAGDGFALADSPFSAYGAGGIYSTIGDLVHWIRNFRTHEVGGAAVADQMLERGVLADGDTLRYAFALFRDGHRGLSRIQHGGALAGYRSFLAYYPEIDAGVLTLGNVASFDSRGIAERVAETAFADAMEIPQRPEAPTEEAEETSAPQPVTLANPEAYIGSYYSEALGMTLHVEREGDGYTIRSDVAPPTELRPLSDTLFLDVGFDVSIRFDLDADGTATGGAVLIGDGFQFVRTEPWVPAPAELAAYVGRYASSEVGTAYEVRLDGDSLVMSHPRRGEMPLIPSQEDEFVSLLLGNVSMERDAAGAVTGLRASFGRVEGLLFEKGEQSAGL